jgi:DNA polymerase-3 subunit epsilon/ATP-dependent DNA helicase DinG
MRVSRAESGLVRVARFAAAAQRTVNQRRLDQFRQDVGNGPWMGVALDDLDVALGELGLEAPNTTIDLADVARFIDPGLPLGTLASIAALLGVDPTASTAEARVGLCARLAEAVLDRARDVDLETLQLVDHHLRATDWTGRLFFAEAYRDRMREMLASRQIANADAASATWDTYRPPERQELKPKSPVLPLDVDEMEAQVSDGGPLARAILGFAERAPQRQMVRAIAQALNGNGTLLVEAGTGTGKTIGYLVPALAHAVANDHQVVVSTNTINLQDQLWNKDLPSVLRATGVPARVAVVKGRGNYLCLRRWRALLQAEDLSQGERMLAARTSLWLRVTSTGDKTELPLTPDEEIAWSRVAATTETCTPGRCRYHRDGVCFIARARRRAEDSHLVVVNHALLLADSVVEGSILPPYRHLIIDEAHHLEDEATRQFSGRVAERELARHLDELAQAGAVGTVGLLADAMAAVRRLLPKQDIGSIEQSANRGYTECMQARQAAGILWDDLRQFVRAQRGRAEGGPTTLRISGSVHAQPDWSRIEIAWAEVVRRLLGIDRVLRDLRTAVEGATPDGEEDIALVGDLTEAIDFWIGTRGLGNDVLAELNDSVIAWISISEGGEASLCTAPLDVGPVLREGLYKDRATVVMTSATLTTQGSFRYIRARLGIEEAEELSLGSAFDYRHAAMVFAPKDAREPNDPDYRRFVEEAVFDAVTTMEGRSMVLFTSHAHLRAAHQALQARFAEAGIRLVAQGVDSTSRSRLLETLKTGERVVLFGAASFWEGVDVVGEALSCLIMVRLPFAQPSDPIVEARAAEFDDGFTQYSLPQAVLRFRQGFGRLIRDQSDRGIMLVLDGRIRTKGYRWAFLRSLPPCPVVYLPSERIRGIFEAWMRQDPRLVQRLDAAT